MGKLISPEELKQLILKEIFAPRHIRAEEFFNPNHPEQKIRDNIFWLIEQLRQNGYLAETTHIKQAFDLTA